MEEDVRKIKHKQFNFILQRLNREQRIHIFLLIISTWNKTNLWRAYI